MTYKQQPILTGWFGDRMSVTIKSRLGGNPEDDGSFLGKTHQRFLDLKSAVTGRDEKAIINEVERGEDYLKEKFEAALQSDKLTGDTRTVIERAFTSVRRGH